MITDLPTTNPNLKRITQNGSLVYPILDKPTSSGSGNYYNDLLDSLIQNSTDYSSLLNVQKTQAPNIMSKLPDILGMQKSFGESYSPYSEMSNQAFQDYLKSIISSPAEEGLKKTEEEEMQQILDEIRNKTKENVSNVKLTALERGIGGVGRISDIEANAIAQALSGGQKAESEAKTSLYKTQAQREIEKERRISEAYGQRYTSMQDLASKAASSDVEISTNAMKVVSDMLGLTYKTETGLQESYADRLQKGQIAAYELDNQSKLALMDNLFKQMLQKERLSSEESQFVRNLGLQSMKLQSDIDQANVNRASGENAATQSLFNQVMGGINVAGEALDTVGGIGLGITSLF